MVLSAIEWEPVKTLSHSALKLHFKHLISILNNNIKTTVHYITKWLVSILQGDSFPNVSTTEVVYESSLNYIKRGLINDTY